MAEIQSRVLARAVATATRDALARRESIALLHGSEAAEVMKSKRAGGMDAGLLAVSVEVGKNSPVAGWQVVRALQTLRAGDNLASSERGGGLRHAE